MRSASLIRNIRKTESDWAPNIKPGVTFYVEFIAIEYPEKEYCNSIYENAEQEQEEDIVIYKKNKLNLSEKSNDQIY